MCFHTSTSQLDYKLTSIVGDTTNSSMQFYMKPLFKSLKPFNESMFKLKLDLNAVTDSYIRFRAVPDDPDYQPTAVPIWKDLPLSHLTKPLYRVVHSLKGDRFTLKVVRYDTNQTIINMDGGPLMMTKDYLEFNLKTPSTNVYGLGEGTHTSLKHSMNFEQWRLFDRSGRTTTNGKLYYGVHPFYICIEHTGSAHGVLVGLSQPSEVALNPGPSISFRTSGGLMDIHVFLGPTPKDVIRQYTDVVGKPFMPPQWALGYHTCREAGNTTISQFVIRQMENASIPHESDCGDALLLRTLSLPSSSEVYKNLATISNNLADSERKFILYQGLQVSNGSSTSNKANPAYDDGVTEHVFIKRNKSSLYIGKLNSGSVVYPDVFSVNITAWMLNQYSTMKDTFDANDLHVDGVVLVDNTPLDITNKTASPCPSGYLPPVANYTVNYYKEGNDTVCLTALQMDGSAHYVRHNLYGAEHLKLVSETIRSNGPSAATSRSFLASLSTFSGSGFYGGHWGGEYGFSWSDMNNSIVQMLEFGLYGIPLTGASICGYQGSISTETLCWKWMQLGSMYPLAFTYYGQNQVPREPVFFDKSFQTMTRDVLLVRSQLLPYMYTQFFNAYKYGDPVVRPLFYEFPNDTEVLSNSQQFMWGSGILISPVVNPNAVISYFPTGYWYEYQTHRCIYSDNGTYYDLIDSLHLPNIHIRGGSVIVRQIPALTTTETRRNNYTIIVAHNQNATGDEISAVGEVYLDDGLTLGSPYLHVEFIATNSSYESRPIHLDTLFNPDAFNVSTTVGRMYFLGMVSKPEEVTIILNGQPVPVSTGVQYIELTESLILDFDIIDQDYDLRQNVTIQWN